jgi:hypothetical protein
MPGSVPERLQQPPCFVHGVRAVRVNWVPGRVTVEQPYPQALRVGVELADVGSARRRGAHPVTDAGTVHRIQHRRGVSDRAADAQLGTGA